MNVRTPVTAGVLAFLDLVVIWTSSDRLRRRKTIRDARVTANPLTRQTLHCLGLVLDDVKQQRTEITVNEIIFLDKKATADGTEQTSCRALHQ